MASNKTGTSSKTGSVNRSSIFNFRSAVVDLARPNLFQVETVFPQFVYSGGSGTGTGGASSAASAAAQGSTGGGSAAGMSLSTFLVKAANLPASNVGVVEVPYRGRTLKIAGDRTYEPWTVTVMNDVNFELRKMFERWSQEIQALEVNIQGAGVSRISDYQTSAIVRQYDREGVQTRAYEFQGIWPSAISAIDLAWDSNDTVEEYTVEFQVQTYSYVDDSNAGHGATGSGSITP